MAAPDPPRPTRRFYATASVAEAGESGFAVRLDARQARTPGGRPLVLPTRALAELIVAEWAAQGPSIEAQAMPATRLAGQALDGGAPARAIQIQTVEGYGASDLVCYFADAPRALVARQETVWAPLLDWARDTHRLELVRAQGVIHIDQPPESLERLAALARDARPFELAGLAFGAALFGSTIIALALRHERLDAVGALAAARLDEVFQAEQWGVDAEAAARAAAMAAEAAMLERWFLALA